MPLYQAQYAETTVGTLQIEANNYEDAMVIADKLANDELNLEDYKTGFINPVLCNLTVQNPTNYKEYAHNG